MNSIPAEKYSRILAFIIDLLITVIVSIVLTLFGVPYLVIIALLIFYIIIPSVKGQTIGKNLLKIKIISKTGLNVGYGKNILRFIGYVINIFTFGVGFLMCVFREDGRGLHDMIAGTYVVRSTESESEILSVPYQDINLEPVEKVMEIATKNIKPDLNIKRDKTELKNTICRLKKLYTNKIITKDEFYAEMDRIKNSQ